MLKKIPVNELRLGMHLHALEGAWLDHPFWRARFVLHDERELRRVQQCGVAECWIDVSLGIDTAGPVTGAASVPAAAHDGEAAVAAEPGPPSGAAPPTPLAVELREAAAICRRGREAVIDMFNEARMGRAVDPSRSRALVEEVTESLERNSGALISLARLKTKDDYTYMHSVAVCALMVALARQLELDEATTREAGLAGLMHDVGKALMPLAILNKPGRLTDVEWVEMRRHPERGHALLERWAAATPGVLDVALHHHERIDGRGYPHGRHGEELSLVARMGAICDVYDAITSNRPYKEGWDPAESIARMASWKGQFDTRLFGAFVHSLGIYPVGSVVRLKSGRLAVVVEQSPSALLSPVVSVFFSTKSQLHIDPERVDLARPGCRDRIVAREPGAAAEFRRLDELWADPDVLRRIQR